MKKNYDIDDSSMTDESGKKYTDLPIELDWTKPSQAHYLGIINDDRQWTHSDNFGEYCWCIKGDTLYFDIQCSKTDEDWHANLDYYQGTLRDDQRVSFRGSKFKVHEGFYSQYLSYRNEFLDLCYRPEVKKIYIGGYSFGAAITSIAVQDAVYHFAEFDMEGNIIRTTKEIYGVGYDGARTFSPNKKLKQYFNGHFTMIKTHWDPVVHCPPAFSCIPFLRFSIYPFKIWFTKHLNFICYKTYGKVIWIGSIFDIFPMKHSRKEISPYLLKKFGE